MTTHWNLQHKVLGLFAAVLAAYGLYRFAPAYLAFDWCGGASRDPTTHSVICAPPGLDFYWQLALEQPLPTMALATAMLLTLAVTLQRVRIGRYNIAWLLA